MTEIKRPPHPERIPGTGKENGLGVTGLPKACARPTMTDAKLEALVARLSNMEGE